VQRTTQVGYIRPVFYRGAISTSTDDRAVIILRVPKELKAAIQKRAKDESRTMNAELNVVLWRTFGPYRSSFGD